MRVLYVNDHEWLGGTEVFVHQISNRMKEMGHDVFFAFAKNISNRGHKLSPKLGIYYNLNDSIVFKQTDKILESVKPDVVHLNNLRSLTLAPLKATKERGIPRVISIHDYWPVCPRRSFLTAGAKICVRRNWHSCFNCAYINHDQLRVRFLASLFQWLNNRILNRHLAQCREILNQETLVCASYTVRDYLVKFGYDPRRIHIIPYGVDTEIFKPHYNENGNIVLWVGRLVKPKGLGFFINMAKLVRKKHPKVEFVVVGGKASKELLAFAGDDVKFIDQVSNERVADFYSKSLMLVVTSIWPEPFGIVALEAMACGKPVIAFASGGLREIIIDDMNGFLVEPKDCQQLAAKVSYLLENSDVAQEMGKNARRFIKSNFSIDLTAKTYEDLYEHLKKES